MGEGEVSWGRGEVSGGRRGKVSGGEGCVYPEVKV